MVRMMAFLSQDYYFESEKKALTKSWVTIFSFIFTVMNYQKAQEVVGQKNISSGMISSKWGLIFLTK